MIIIRLIFFSFLSDLLFDAAVQPDDERVNVGVETPFVEQKPGGFDADAEARSPNHELRRGARRGAGDRPVPRPHQNRVEMAGYDAGDLRVRAHDLSKPVGILESIRIQAWHAGTKRRVMHRKDRRPARVELQFRIEPREAFIIDESAAAPRGG
jgi:hypothetical protein